MNQLHSLVRRMTSIFVICLLCISSVAQSNNAISFDGTDDYISTSGYVVPVSGDFTIEFWVYTTTYSGYREFVSQGSSGSAFYIGTANATGEIRCGDSWGSTGVIMPLNKWVHIALVKSGTSATLYLDGMKKVTLASGYSISGAGTSFQMGTQYGGIGEYFNGNMDELRIWNTARTQAEIKANMFNKTLTDNTSGLVAYYRFNEGSGTSAGNSCTNTSGIDGTLTNGPLWTASPVQFSANALSFDGVDDYVESAATFNLNMNNSSFTVETWINSGNASANTTTERILMQWGPTWQAGSYQLVCTNSYIHFNFNGSSTGSCTYSVNWQDGNWHHVAGVFDVSTYTLYLYYDGVQKAAVSTAGNVPGALNTSLYIGGSPSVAGSFASVDMDEVRVWNFARTQAEIQADMNHELNYPFDVSGTTPRLYYTFNQGVAGGTNTGLATVIEQYLQAHGNGTLFNFALSGASSNFVTQNNSLAVLPLKWRSFTAQRQNKEVLLQWSTASEVNVERFAMERSGDGKSWKTIGTVESGKGESDNYRYTDPLPLPSVSYYRVKQVDRDGRYSYSDVRAVQMDNDTRSFEVMANPLTNKTLQITTGTAQTLSLFGSDGKRIWSKVFSAGRHTIHLDHVATGIYFLKAGNYSEKIIVQ